jgi:hypothetical protein
VADSAAVAAPEAVPDTAAASEEAAPAADEAVAEAEPTPAPVPAKPAPKPVVAMRGDDRPGMRKAEPAPAGRGGKFGDRKDARDMQKTTRSWVPAALSIIITGGFLGLLTGMMTGYHGQPAKTREAEWFAPDGKRFIRTGDVARFDADGFVVLMDRKKDMVLVSGFNVYPNEVEEVVAGLDGVMECAVVGVADEKTGEAVKLIVVKKDPDLSEAVVRAHCKENLTGYKQPKLIEFCAELPKTPVGKVLRRELRKT